MGFIFVILGLALFTLGGMIEVPTIAGIGWLLSGIGMALYAKGWGHSLVWGFLYGMVPYVGPLIGLLDFARKKKPQRSIRSNLIEATIIVVIIVILATVVIPAKQGSEHRAMMNHVQSTTIEPILAALKEYYKKNGRFPVSTTATVTPSMSGALDKGTDVWTSMGLDKHPFLTKKVSQLDYTSDATGSTMTLRLTLSNFHKDSIDGKIISVTPSPGKETAITWVYNCSPGIDPVVSKYFEC